MLYVQTVILEAQIYNENGYSMNMSKRKVIN